MNRPRLSLLLALLASAVLFAWLEVDRGAVERRVRATFTPSATPSAPSRVLVVLDTVRAERTSLCGYDHPTTPVLDALAARDDARTSCRAYTPGDWTLPSHASFFTGRQVLEHGAHRVAGGDDIGEWLSVRPLDDRLPTLAEELAEQGYQTVSVSGNPLLSHETGLVRGFERVRSGGFGDLEGERLVAALEDELLALDPSRPLFLFLNIADAHEPWDAIGEGHPWLAPRPGMARDLAAWWSGDPVRRERYLAALEPLYTHGVERADRTLGASLALLEERGWLGPDALLVVTSDHGELLGEHGLVGHGRTLLEPNNHVFLVAQGPGVPALGEPISALEAYPLVREGRTGGLPIESSCFSHAVYGQRYGSLAAGVNSVALWEGTTKWVRTGDQVLRYDLAADPGELAPLPGSPEVLEVQARRQRVVAQAEVEEDPELLEMLRAAGYID